MKCQECEPLIYLYEELDGEERKRLDQHLEACPDCVSLLASVQQNHSIIKQAMDFPLTPVDSARLTNNVMDRVFPARTAVSTTGEYIWSRVFRYAFTMASLCILLVFYAEWQSNGTLPANQFSEKNQASKEAALISPSIREMRESRKQSSISLYEKLNKTKQQ